ncbi:hypothetical protein SmJEL517_g05134 [Synchytrium microbalum]|uniref:CTLH domain-containing protein n=1 Tax=Synchytrium microbalum TaxID=1806994 RepID=A0A507C0C7_9FUNG|nr:uncharacterized protein SmJEL517_g05134 [Synchytrium microbalum]TPX31514.1 hypothetical protein SmJEL517_g05134 [Synchytrium microbalum]
MSNWSPSRPAPSTTNATSDTIPPPSNTGGLAGSLSPPSILDTIDTSLQLDQDLLPQLVYEYLVHNCYSATASSFATLWLAGDSTTHNTHASDNNTIDKKHQDTHMDIVNGGMSMVVDDDGDLLMGGTPSNNTTPHTQQDIYARNASRRLLLSAAARKPSNASIASSSTSNGTTMSSSLEPRKQLYSLVCSGRILEAVAYCHAHFPDALNGKTPESEDVCFKLQCQQFIECVRNSGVDALKFAQEELIKYQSLGDKYAKTFNDVIALLAYTDPEHSPLSEYLSLKHREDVAMALNMVYDRLPAKTALERLARQSTAVRMQLEEMGREKKSKVAYPHWSLPGFLAGEEK